MKVMTAKKATKAISEYPADEWTMEPKLDGFRATITKRGRSVEILSRTSKSQAGKLPHLESAISQVWDDDFVLDGELIWFTDHAILEDGVFAPLGDFNKTMRIMGSGVEKALAKQDEFGGTHVHMVFFAFDILESNGHDVTGLNFSFRRKALESLVCHNEFGPYVSLTPSYEPSQDLYDAYVDAGGEGMMLKRRNAPYQQRRSSYLLKVKAQDTLDAVVTGFTAGKGEFSDTIGAVEFSQYENGKLVYIGRCSGFDVATRYDIGSNPEMYLGSVIEVKHYGVVQDAEYAGLRHPTFVRFRYDKLAEECTK